MKWNCKEWARAAGIRALHTVAQALFAAIPAGLVITAEMIRSADWGAVGLSILGWLGTGLLAGVISFLKSAAIGIPEVEFPKPDTDRIADEHQAEVDRKEGLSDD